MKKSVVLISILIIAVLILVGGFFLFKNGNTTPRNSVLVKTPTPSASPVSSKLSTKYITEVDWPPTKKIENKAFNCTGPVPQDPTVGQTEKIVVNKHTYCVTKKSEGAAGSVYTTYAYSTRAKGNQTEIFTFSLKFVQCANYSGSQKTECEKERQSFDVDKYMDSYIQANK